MKKEYYVVHAREPEKRVHGGIVTEFMTEKQIRNFCDKTKKRIIKLVGKDKKDLIVNLIVDLVSAERERINKTGRYFGTDYQRNYKKK